MAQEYDVEIWASLIMSVKDWKGCGWHGWREKEKPTQTETKPAFFKPTVRQL